MSVTLNLYWLCGKCHRSAPKAAASRNCIERGWPGFACTCAHPAEGLIDVYPSWERVSTQTGADGRPEILNQELIVNSLSKQMVTYGTTIRLDAFMRAEKLSTVIRGHELQPNGYSVLPVGRPTRPTKASHSAGRIQTGRQLLSVHTGRYDLITNPNGCAGGSAILRVNVDCRHSHFLGLYYPSLSAHTAISLPSHCPRHAAVSMRWYSRRSPHHSAVSSCPIPSSGSVSRPHRRMVTVIYSRRISISPKLHYDYTY